MIHNFTTDHQVNHRSIRQFKDQSLTAEQLTTLYEAARHTSSSMFLQQFSILHLTDPKKRAAVREISKQSYVGANGDLLISLFSLPIYTGTNKFGTNSVMMTVVSTLRIFLCKLRRTQF